ncbi:glycoside hydrolase family 2 protein [Wocania ichthyoenteri]|uniref:glycoside hydrolase family 2 protein n=1 Tax=Wocania ichthyoenteri TaxID=1230531 RepID=UPI00053EA4ED|nr:glycoside hydrolase family 2 [Wocania ichthyoenteri]
MKNLSLKIVLLFFIATFSAVQAQTGNEVSVAYNDSGNNDNQPFLVLGENYTFPDEKLGNEVDRSCNFGSKIIYAFDNIDINATYSLRAVFVSDKDRTINITADGNIIGEPIKLSKGSRKEINLQLPAKSYAYKQLVLVFELVSGISVVISELEIYSSNKTSLTPFSASRQKELIKSTSFEIKEKIEVEKFLPQYTPRPIKVNKVYNPILTLNGDWKFNEKPEVDFHKTNASSKWNTINVPGEWAMQGYKVDSAAFAGYERKFNIPTDWKGKRVKLRFDGVSSECTVWINGQEVGSHMGGMTAFEFDVTKYLRDDTNSVSLKVRNESLADMLGSLTQYAAHQIGGITRKVTLFAVPEVHLSDIRIVTDLDENYTNAILKLKLEITNLGITIAKNKSLRFTLPEENLVKEFNIQNINVGETITKIIEIPVENPKKWTNETPNMYDFYTDILDENNLSERVANRIGFREVELRGSELLVNGVSVKLRGVNRHEVHPLTGRVLNQETWEKDIELYNKANCNYIRTSHYPPGEEFIALCNEKGMFVEVEAPICWIGHHANKNWLELDYKDEKYFPYMLQANMETIQFYRNHPSIIFWSAANESYWNYNFAKLMKYVDAADTTRPNAFHDQGYGGFNNQGSTASIANIHYPGPNGYKKAADFNKPLIYGEYCHLNVYNRRELITDPGVRNDWAMALAPTWENMYYTKGILGGAIWSGVDDIFQMPNGDAVGYGPWGPIDGWRREKPEYWHVKKVYSPIRVLTKQLDVQNTFKVEIENRYSFINLKSAKVVWSYGEEEGVVFPDIEPGQTGFTKISVQNLLENEKLNIKVYDPRGFLTDEFVIPVGEQTYSEVVKQKASVKTKFNVTKSEITIKGTGFECVVSKVTGQIISLKKNNSLVLNGGPWLMALPLDGEGCEPDHDANIPPFNDLAANWKATSVQAQKEGSDIKVSVKGAYNEFIGDYTLMINANGELTIDYSFTSKIDVNPRQWGMVFNAPKSYNTLFWNREGRWTSYPSKHIGRTFGEAPIFYEGVPDKINPREEPLWHWSMDFNKLGSNDFRSTRRNFNYAGLKNNNGQQVMAISSDATQHWRSWLNGDDVQFLVAKFVTAGNELFLGSYYEPTRVPLKVGDIISDEIKIQIK